MKFWHLLTVIAAIGVLCGLAGCSTPEATPSPSPAGATTAGAPMKATDPRVLNDPNVPESIKQQIRGGAPAGAPK